MIYSLSLVLVALVYICDCGQFDNTLIQGNQVWVNNSEAALLKWRYTPESNELTLAVIKCYFEVNGDKKYVIRREGTGIPKLESDIQQTELQGKVEPYVNSTDKTIFGFRIIRASISDPKEYLCNAIFNVPNNQGDPVPDDADSKPLLLQVIVPPDVSQCRLTDIRPAKYDSTLTLKCIAPGNPKPDVECFLLDRNNTVLPLLNGLYLGPEKENVTKEIRNDGNTLLKLWKIVCNISTEYARIHRQTTEGKALVLRPPFPPKDLKQYYPDGALATSVHLQWAPIPAPEQGGGRLNGYEISYWVKQQSQYVNRTDVSVGSPPSTDGLISYEIRNLQTGLEYKVAVYGRNQYLSDDVEMTFYAANITVTTSVGPVTPASSTSNKNTGAIIGGVIGGVVFIIIVIILVVYCTRRDDRQKHFPTSYVDDVVDYPPAQGGHQLYSTVEKKRVPSHDDDSTSGYPDIISTTQNGDYGNQMRSKSSSSFEPSSKVYL